MMIQAIFSFSNSIRISYSTIVQITSCNQCNITITNTNIKAVYESGRVGFWPNLDLTCRRRVEGGVARNRPQEKSVGSVSGDGEC